MKGGTMITNKKKWKDLLSSEKFKNAQMSAARKLGNALAVLVHCDLEQLNPEKKKAHQSQLNLQVNKWRIMLDARTLDAVCCDRCLHAIVPGGPASVAKQVWAAAGITIH